MAEEQRRLTFDPTINAGHLLTFAGMRRVRLTGRCAS